MTKRMTREQRYAHNCGVRDGKAGRVDGWAMQSPSYQRGLADSRKEVNHDD